MTFSVVIPARYAASRLPGKALLDIAGKPMIQRTFEQAQASAASAVYIATDDERIKTVAEGFGARVCMTSAEHRSGTDSLQEGDGELKFPDQHIVGNVPGHEPLVPPPARGGRVLYCQTDWRPRGTGIPRRIRNRERGPGRARPAE